MFLPPFPITAPAFWKINKQITKDYRAFTNVRRCTIIQPLTGKLCKRETQLRSKQTKTV